jgi:hypothetical protein
MAGERGARRRDEEQKGDDNGDSSDVGSRRGGCLAATTRARASNGPRKIEERARVQQLGVVADAARSIEGGPRCGALVWVSVVAELCERTLRKDCVIV